MPGNICLDRCSNGGKNYRNHDEAFGYVLASGGRGPGVIFDALFSVVAFNAFALSLADCSGKVFGGTLQASAVVSTLATIEGAVSPFISPFLGGIADTTTVRKTLLGATFAIVSLTYALQAVLYISVDTERIDPATLDNDEPDVLAQPVFYSDGALIALGAIILINVLVYELTALLTVSYSPELVTYDEKIMTRAERDTLQMSFIADSYAANNGSQLLFLAIVIAAALAFGLNSFEQGMVGGFVCTAYSTIIFYYGFYYLGSRRDIDPELNKQCCGTRQLFSAFLYTVTNYHEVLKYLVSWSFAAAAVSSSVALATTYFQLYLGYDGTTVSVLLGIALLCSVPGSILAGVWHDRFGIAVKKLYIIVATVYGLTYMLAPFILVSEPFDGNNGTLSAFGQCENITENAAVGFLAPGGVYPFAIIFVVVNGLCLGHLYPLNTQFYALLIPGGEENTYYGIKVTFSKIWTWLPPAVFTYVAIENDGDLRFALMANGSLFLLGAIVAIFIDIEKGKEDVKDTIQFRQGGNFRRLSVQDNLDKVGIMLDGAGEDGKGGTNGRTVSI